MGASEDDEKRSGESGMSRREFALGAATATAAGSVLAAGVASAVTRGAGRDVGEIAGQVGEVAKQIDPTARPPRRTVERAPVPTDAVTIKRTDGSGSGIASPHRGTGGSAAAGADPLDDLGDMVDDIVRDPGTVVDVDPERPPRGDDPPPVIEEPPFLTGAELVEHIARRLTFGPTAELVEEIQLLGPAVWIERQLRPDLVVDTDMDRTLAGYQTLGWTNAESLSGDVGLALDELRHATLLRAVRSKRQLFETMVDFWTNHLNTYVGKGRVRYLKTTEDREVIRRHAVGSFADLLVASAKSPAMLEYLDNASSRGANPNENYGRELLELHTVGVNGGYTEDDVRGVAYVLTGWTWDRDTGEFVFRDDWHFDGPASVLGWSTTGRSGPGAIADGESLLRYLAGHPATARFLATKLAERFIGDDPPGEVIASTATAYLESGTDIAATLRHLFGTDAFLSGGDRKFRRPFDLVTSTLRASEASIDPAPQGDAARRLDSTLRDLGQRLFDQPPPTGYPDEEVDWVSTDGLLRRWSWAVEVVVGRVAGVTVDVDAFVGDPPPEDAGELVDRLLAILHRPVEPSDRAAVLTFLGVEPTAPMTDELRADAPLAAALVLGSASAQYR